MSLVIKGLQKTSLVDYPGKIACTIFLPNCNFRCGFCHNKDLVINPDKLESIDEKKLLDFLKERKKWIEGICITGGEPLLYKEITNFLKKVKEFGYAIKIDTNGTNPELISELIKEKLVDFIAMDIKNSFERYNETAGTNVSIEKIKKSIEIIKNSKIDYEFRTTVVPGLHRTEDIKKIGEITKGCKKLVIQNFRADENVIDARYKNHKAFSRKELEEFKEILKPYSKSVEIRT